MSQFKLWYSSQPRALRLLLATNVIVYVLWQVFFIHFEAMQRLFFLHLALNPAAPGILYEPWQLLTYAFLHLQPGFGGLMHILFNMLWMMWIGRDYEALYGPGRILGIYVYGAVGGALLTVLLSLVFPGAGLFTGIVHGASGAVMAIMTAVAIHHPQQRISLMFIGVVRLIHVVIGFIALDILFLSAGGTSVSAHIGGVAAGFAAGKMALRGENPAAWADRLFRSVPPPRGPQGGTAMQRMERWLESRRHKSEPPPRTSGTAKVYHMDVQGKPTARDDSSEVDRILDKISASGYDSLTKREKQTLLDAGGKK